MRIELKVKDIIEFRSTYPSIEKKKNRIIVRISSPKNVWGLVNFITVAIPLIKRAYPELVSEKLVSVQPMQLPRGDVFYLDYVYKLVWKYNIILNKLVHVSINDKNKDNKNIKIKCELRLKFQAQ